MCRLRAQVERGPECTGPRAFGVRFAAHVRSVSARPATKDPYRENRELRKVRRLWLNLRFLAQREGVELNLSALDPNRSPAQW